MELLLTELQLRLAISLLSLCPFRHPPAARSPGTKESAELQPVANAAKNADPRLNFGYNEPLRTTDDLPPRAGPRKSSKFTASWFTPAKLAADWIWARHVLGLTTLATAQRPDCLGMP